MLSQNPIQIWALQNQQSAMNCTNSDEEAQEYQKFKERNKHTLQYEFVKQQKIKIKQKQQPQTTLPGEDKWSRLLDSCRFLNTQKLCKLQTLSGDSSNTYKQDFLKDDQKFQLEDVSDMDYQVSEKKSSLSSSVSSSNASQQLEFSRDAKYSQFQYHQNYLDKQQSRQLTQSFQREKSKQDNSSQPADEMEKQIEFLQGQHRKVEGLINREQAIEAQCANSLARLEKTLAKNRIQMKSLEEQTDLYAKKIKLLDVIPPPIHHHYEQVSGALQNKKQIQKQIIFFGKKRIEQLKELRDCEKTNINAEEDAILRLRFEIHKKSIINNGLLKILEEQKSREKWLCEREKQRVSLCSDLKCLKELYRLFLGPLRKKQRERRPSRSACVVLCKKRRSSLNYYMFKQNIQSESLIGREQEELRISKKLIRSLSLGINATQLAELHQNDNNGLEVEEEDEEITHYSVDSLQEEDYMSDEIETFRLINKQLKRHLKDFYTLIGGSLSTFLDRLLTAYSIARIENSSLDSSFKVLTTNIQQLKITLEGLTEEIKVNETNDNRINGMTHQLGQYLDIQNVAIDSGIVVLRQISHNAKEIDGEDQKANDFVLSFKEEQITNQEDKYNQKQDQLQTIQDSSEFSQKLSTINAQFFDDISGQELRSLTGMINQREKQVFNFYLFLIDFSFRISTIVKLLAVNSGFVPLSVQIKMRDLSQVLGKKNIKLFVPTYSLETDEMYKHDYLEKQKNEQFLTNSKPYTIYNSSTILNSPDKGSYQNLLFNQNSPILAPQLKSKKQLSQQSPSSHSIKFRQSLQSPSQGGSQKTILLEPNPNEDSFSLSNKAGLSPKAVELRKRDSSCFSNSNHEKKEIRRTKRFKTIAPEMFMRGNANLSVHSSANEDLRYEQDMPTWNQVVQVQKLFEMAQLIFLGNSLVNAEQLKEGVQYLYGQLRADRSMGYFLREDKIQEFFRFVKGQMFQLHGLQEQRSKKTSASSMSSQWYYQQQERENSVKIDLRKSNDSKITVDSPVFLHINDPLEQSSIPQIFLSIPQNSQDYSKAESDDHHLDYVDTAQRESSVNNDSNAQIFLEKLSLKDVIQRNLSELKLMAQNECKSHLRLISHSLRDLLYSINKDKQNRKASKQEDTQSIKKNSEKPACLGGNNIVNLKEIRKRDQHVFETIHGDNKFIKASYNKAGEKMHGNQALEGEPADILQPQRNSLSINGFGDQSGTCKMSEGNNSEHLLKSNNEEYREFISKACELHKAARHRSFATLNIQKLLRQYYQPPQPLHKIHFIQQALMPFLRRQIEQFFSEHSNLDQNRQNFKSSYQIEQQKTLSQIPQNLDIELDKKSAQKSCTIIIPRNIQKSCVVNTSPPMKQNEQTYDKRMDNKNNNNSSKDYTELQNKSQLLSKIAKLDRFHPPRLHEKKDEILKNGAATLRGLLGGYRMNNPSSEGVSDVSKDSSSEAILIRNSHLHSQLSQCSDKSIVITQDNRPTKLIQDSMIIHNNMNNTSNCNSSSLYSSPKMLNVKLLKPLSLSRSSKITRSSPFDNSRSSNNMYNSSKSNNCSQTTATIDDINETMQTKDQKLLVQQKTQLKSSKGYVINNNNTISHPQLRSELSSKLPAIIKVDAVKVINSSQDKKSPKILFQSPYRPTELKKPLRFSPLDMVNKQQLASFNRFQPL